MKAVEGSVAPGSGIERELGQLAREASIEVTPQRILRGPALTDLLPRQTSVYVPFLPNADFTDTIDACRRLAAERLVPVPHLPARAMASRDELRERLAGLRDAGADRLLLIAGDKKRAAGPFESTLDVLDSGLLCDYGFRRLGIAGHPEGHPLLGTAELDRALGIKQAYAADTGSELWIVTQFVFTSKATIAWLRRLQAAANPLPVRIGVPGPARLRTLIAYAAQCGVSASARVLRRQPGAARLLTFWAPDGLLRDLAYHRSRAPLFAGIHLFPFGGVARSARWLDALRCVGTTLDEQDVAGAPPA